MEEEAWLLAAQKVLQSSQTPLHYTDIKKMILDQRLVSPGLKTTLEEALFKEIQRPTGRFKSIFGQPGVFGLVKSENPQEVSDRPQQSILPAQLQKPKVKVGGAGGAKVITVSTSQGVKYVGNVTVAQRPKAATSLIHTKRPGGGSTLSQGVQERYKAKYKMLRKQTKSLIFVNGALCDEVIALEEKIQKVKDERRYLLTRLLQHQAVTDSLLPPSASGSSTSGASGVKHTAQSIAQILGEVEKRKKKTTQPGLTPAGKKKTAKELLDDTPKPKPKKPRTGASNRRLVHDLPLDNLGRPILPIELGNLTVYCIGEIVSDRAGFHSPENIFPVGYCSTRVYASIRNPEERCLYTCKILDSRQGVRFDISPEDAPNMVFSASTASECHLKLLKAINQGRPSEVVPLTPHGPEFFGLSHSTVQHLIQSIPGAKKCSQYKWIRFEISKVSVADSHDKEEPTVGIEALHSLPVFSSLQKSQRAQQASLRSLLTTGTS